MNENTRIIGEYEGTARGPLLIVFGGMHGNEPAGVFALRRMFSMLEKEPSTNPDFQCRGKIVGLLGNKRAFDLKKRFINRDLNRQWTKENVEKVYQTDKSALDEEELEMLELLTEVRKQINDYQPEQLIFLDLHTTTAFGGIFSIPQDNAKSLRIAIELHAPVITKMVNGIKGTSLHYFTSENFIPDTTCVVFESGQHNEELSVNRAIAAITNCMRTIDCVTAEHVENKHDRLLIEYSDGLPKVAKLVKRHPIDASDNFQMEPNFKNFQRVQKDELIARDRKGPIHAESDSLILMPLYQKQGEDGFFLIEEVSDY